MSVFNIDIILNKPQQAIIKLIMSTSLKNDDLTEAVNVANAEKANVAKAEKAQVKAEKVEAAKVAKAEKAEAARVAKAEKAEAARVAKVEKAEAAKVAKAEKAEAAKVAKETKKVKRQNCEHNNTEILTALILDNKEIQIEDILNMVSPPPNVKCSYEDFIEYKEDLSLKMSKGMTHQKRIKQYLENLKDQIKNTYFQDNVDKVFVCGKNNKHDEIDELNKNLNKNNKKNARADIYIKLKNGKFIGLSVKSSSKDPLTNYAIRKYYSCEDAKQSNQIQTKFLNDNGFPIPIKDERPHINKILKENLNNPIFKNIKENHKKYGDKIAESLIKSINGSILDYDLWEYNGTELYKLNKTFDNDSIKFYECDEYYLTQKKSDRYAAKMFYKLCHKKDTYRVEIRWKGKFHNNSPQFLCYKT